MRILIRLAALALALAVGAFAATAQHPFMLWTKDDAARMKRQMATEAWARDGYDRAVADLKAAGPKGVGPEGYLLPLFQYGVLGDRAAGEQEKAALLKEVAAGNFASVANAYRYDILYDLLTPEERARVLEAFTKAVRSNLTWNKPYNRWNWLPNLEYGWYCRLHLLAAATGDETLIRGIFNAPLGYKWYFDEYLSDLGFYGEELSKMIAPEYILPWAWAMDRLGLSDLGFGYRGRQGATVRGQIDSLLCVGYPRVDLGTDLQHYPRLVMGDTRGSFGEEYFAYGLQQDNVPGALASGPTLWWSDARGHRLRRWLEFLHATYPDGQYDYFLAQWRAPGQAQYDVSPWFGLPPIDPMAVTPPPAPSGVYPQRGIVMLRAEESPAYWESPAPAVGMRLATPYPHHAADSFAMLGFYAFNRPIFINPGRTTDRYVGVDPTFSGSVRSHCTVIVDGKEPSSLLDGVTVKHDFTPEAKYVSARAKGIHAGVDQTRSMVLTREYLLDVFHLSSDDPRDYYWQVHTFGHACPDAPADWAPSLDLLGMQPDFGHEQSMSTSKTWSITAVQTTGGAHRTFSGLGTRWFERRVGVRVTMLGEEGTRAYTAWTPVMPNVAGFGTARNRFAYGEEEPARLAIAATRRGRGTTFVALHEPFEGVAQLRETRLLASGLDWRIIRVSGPDFSDYVMLRYGAKAEEAVAAETEDGVFHFRNYAYIRVTKEGTKQAGTFEGRLPTLRTAQVDARVGPLAVRWDPPTELCLPTDGERAVRLKLRNNGQTVINGSLELTATGDLSVIPNTIQLRDFSPAGEKEVVVTVKAGRAPRNAMRQVVPRMEEPTGLPIQVATLDVAHGVTAAPRVQIGNQYRISICSPRYIARYWPMDSVAAQELLDPQGYRRNDASGTSYPFFTETVTSAEGRASVQRIAPRKHPYFRPVADAGKDGEASYLYEGGRHVHGFQSDLEQWFTEDWIVIRRRNKSAEERVALHWPWMTAMRSSAAMGRDEKLAAQLEPGVTFVVDSGGKRIEVPKGLSAVTDMEIRAAYVRPHGYEYGYLALYPPGSRLQRGEVTHAGDAMVGFTFCTVAEFDGLLAKWMENPPSGEVSAELAGRYRGAGMPQPVRAEE